MLQRHYAGWTYQRTKLSDEYTPDRYLEERGEEHEIILVVRKGALLFASQETPVKLEIGDTVLAYLPKSAEPKSDAASDKNGSSTTGVEPI